MRVQKLVRDLLLEMGNLPEKKTIEFGTPNDSIRLIQFASNLWCLLAEL